MDGSVLNLDQSPAELNRVHGDLDYYAYLRHPLFVEAFIKPLATVVNELGGSVLDVGCGDAPLLHHVRVPYAGFDGSQAAVDRIRLRVPNAAVFVGRIERPPFSLEWRFATIVFGGLLSVLVNPERHVEFVRSYTRFSPSHFIVYDLQRLDTAALDAEFERTYYYRNVINQQAAAAELPGIEPVKLDRKIIVYRYPQ